MSALRITLSFIHSYSTIYSGTKALMVIFSFYFHFLSSLIIWIMLNLKTGCKLQHKSFKVQCASQIFRGRFGGCVMQSASMCVQTLLFPKDTACVSLVFYFSEDTKCTKGIKMPKFRLTGITSVLQYCLLWPCIWPNLSLSYLTY